MSIKNLDNFLKQSPVLKGELVVLQKTENSELIEFVKPCNNDFFEQVFSINGPYWNTYAELGFGKTPFDVSYLVVLNARMYFCRNVEKKFLYKIGPKKSFAYNGDITEVLKLSVDNLISLFSVPFDFSSQVASIALAQIRINEKLQEFELFSEKSKVFWKHNQKIRLNDLASITKNALEGAVESMKYSFYSSMAYSLKVKLRTSNAWKECELEKLSKLVKKNQIQQVKELFGFYSKNPYDVSFSRFLEKPSDAGEFKEIKWPKNSAARWRENCKFLCARYLGILRKCYLEFGKANGLGEKVFFLKPSELAVSKNDLLKIIEKREKLFQDSIKGELPKSIVYDGKWNIKYEPTKPVASETKKIKIKGIAAGGQGIVEGKIVFVDTEVDYKKDLDGKIVISKTLSPNLTLLFDRISAIVSEGGGKVAHTAIVSLEQGMPCVVQTKNLDLLKEGDKIRVNGSTGKIEKL
ncbi:MAG: PEP-utilizing enzyme [Candidatus Diapherotrites archaeon]